MKNASSISKRLQRITLNYGGYLAGFTTKNPNFSKLDYWHQYQVLMADGFGWADFLTRNLKPRGWEVWEPVTNFEQHQKTWARENSIVYQQENWLHEIALAQIKHFRPDVLFVDSFTAFDVDFIQQIRSDVPNLRRVVGWCGAPPPDYAIFRAFDLTLSNIPSLVDFFCAQDIPSELLPHSFEVSMLSHLNGCNEKPVDFTFTGSIFEGSDHHGERLGLLASLCRATDLQVYADIESPRFRDIVRCFVGRSESATLRRQFEKFGVVRHSKEAVYGVQMYQLLADSKVTFNNHIGFSQEHASNTRLFQATGCGACLLTDWKPDLVKYFEPDSEVVTYRSAQEAEEKVKWLLGNESARQAIAKAGQKRALRDHTFALRTEALLEIVERYS